MQPTTKLPLAYEYQGRPIEDNGEVIGTMSADRSADRPAPGRTPQLVIFDLDGTLTDSAGGIVASFLHALAHIGAPAPDGDLSAQIVGPPMDDTFRVLELGRDTEEAIAAFRAEYGSRGWAMNTLFDGVAPLLADLRAAGVRLAVATSKLEPDRPAHPRPLRAGPALRGRRRRGSGRLPARPRSRRWPTLSTS